MSTKNDKKIFLLKIELSVSIERRIIFLVILLKVSIALPAWGPDGGCPCMSPWGPSWGSAWEPENVNITKNQYYLEKDLRVALSTLNYSQIEETS